MKQRIKKFGFLFIIIGISFASCKKEDQTGDLFVYVEDVNENPIVNETVYLYLNEADFNNVIFSETKTTNNNGRVEFKLLDPGVYYVDCDFDNAAGGVTTVSGSGSVSAGMETTITIFP